MGAVNIEINEYRTIVGMRKGRGIRRNRRKPAPVALCPPPQIPHDLGSNPSSRDEKLATNRMKYGTVWVLLNLQLRNNEIPSKCYRKCLSVTRDFLFIKNNKISVVLKGIFLCFTLITDTFKLGPFNNIRLLVLLIIKLFF
jgi:hypothetical protein